VSKFLATRRSSYWTTVLVYGLALALVVVLLKYVQYRFWVRDLSVEVYIGMVAALFTAVGVWLGSRKEGDRGDQRTAER
jgi:uncharacterized membrane protein YhaH (DUF805 family)